MNKIITTSLFAAVALGMAGHSAIAQETMSGRLDAGERDVYEETYTRGTVDVVVRGRGLGDLDLYVYDEDGDLIAKDEMEDNMPVVSFTNPYRQKLRFVVKNNARVFSASYTGTIN